MPLYCIFPEWHWGHVSFDRIPVGVSCCLVFEVVLPRFETTKGRSPGLVWMLFINCLDAILWRWLHIQKLIQIQTVEQSLADIIRHRNLIGCGLVEGYRFT